MQMADDPAQLNVRVPQSIYSWVQRASKRTGLSQKAFIVSLIEEAMDRSKGPSLFDKPEEPPTASQFNGEMPFRFIDLFAGIGGLRIGLQRTGGHCVFSSEIDPYAQKTYRAWFDEEPAGDIQDFVSGERIPEHHLLAAGFPCQPF